MLLSPQLFHTAVPGIELFSQLRRRQVRDHPRAFQKEGRERGTLDGFQAHREGGQRQIEHRTEEPGAEESEGRPERMVYPVEPRPFERAAQLSGEYTSGDD